jgi:transposase
MAVGLCDAGHDGLSHSARSRLRGSRRCARRRLSWRDGWAPYRKFTQAVPQSCLAHLLPPDWAAPDRSPADDIPSGRAGHAPTGARCADRYQAGDVSVHGLAVARGRLEARMHRRLDRPGTVPDVRGLPRISPMSSQPCSRSCWIPSTTDATNWRAEHAIRPAVVTRKVCGGNRSWAGADSQQILASVIRTAFPRAFNPHVVLASMLHARTPHVATDLN